jgi:hypothetical protein
LACEYLARNGVESPRSVVRKAEAADRPTVPPHSPARAKVRFWPYS